MSKKRRIEITDAGKIDEDREDDEERLEFETAETEDEKDWISCLKVASLLREGKERVVQVT